MTFLEVKNEKNTREFLMCPTERKIMKRFFLYS